MVHVPAAKVFRFATKGIEVEGDDQHGVADDLGALVGAELREVQLMRMVARGHAPELQHEIDDPLQAQR